MSTFNKDCYQIIQSEHLYAFTDESNSLDQDHMTTIHDLQLELRQLRRKVCDVQSV